MFFSACSTSFSISAFIFFQFVHPRGFTGNTTASNPVFTNISTENCLSLLLKRFLSTAFPVFADTENPRRTLPRVFLKYLALITSPRNPYPCLKSLLNCQLFLILLRQCFLKTYGTRRLRPLRLLALITFLPPLVAMRALNPCRLFLEMLLG